MAGVSGKRSGLQMRDFPSRFRVIAAATIVKGVMTAVAAAILRAEMIEG